MTYLARMRRAYNLCAWKLPPVDLTAPTRSNAPAPKHPPYAPRNADRVSARPTDPVAIVVNSSAPVECRRGANGLQESALTFHNDTADFYRK